MRLFVYLAGFVVWAVSPLVFANSIMFSTVIGQGLNVRVSLESMNCKSLCGFEAPTPESLINANEQSFSSALERENILGQRGRLGRGTMGEQRTLETRPQGFNALADAWQSHKREGELGEHARLPDSASVSTVPVPPAMLLFVSALCGLVGMCRKRSVGR